MQTLFTEAQRAQPDIAEADRILRSCVHCGFCTATCPTYVLRGADSNLLRADTAAEMNRRGPRAEIAEVAGVGHAPALMSDDQIATIANWLGTPG